MPSLLFSTLSTSCCARIMRHNIRFVLLFTIVASFACQSNPYKQGKVLYDFHCGGCHSEDGSGLAQLIPALDTTSEYFHNAGKLVCLIRIGLPLNKATGQQMPPNTALSETELTNLINYLGHRFQGKEQWVNFNEIRGLAASCQSPEAPR